MPQHKIGIKKVAISWGCYCWKILASMTHMQFLVNDFVRVLKCLSLFCYVNKSSNL